MAMAVQGNFVMPLRIMISDILTSPIPISQNHVNALLFSDFSSSDSSS